MSNHLQQTEFPFKSKSRKDGGWLIISFLSFILVGGVLFIYLKKDENEISK